jgi:hypothetical protein
LSGVDVVMAGVADHEGFAAPIAHGLFPSGWWVAGPGAVGEPPDVVHLHLAVALADFAGVGQ